MLASANALVDLLPANAAPVPCVLVARREVRAPALFDCGLLASKSDEGRVYRIEPVMVASLDELEHRCQAQAPRVLLVDIGLIERVSDNVLRHLRRRLPATDWLLGWEAPPSHGLDVAVRSQARGCIEWTLNPEHLTRALDAVMAGELWFPRPLLQSLYLSLLEAGISKVAPSSVAAPIADTLTAREAEVLALMRRGMTNLQIAGRLDISVNTVKKHLGRVFEKRGLHGRRQERD